MPFKKFADMSPEEREAAIAVRRAGARAAAAKRSLPRETQEASQDQPGAHHRATPAPQISRSGLSEETIAKIRAEARDYVDQQLRERSLASAKEQEAKFRADLIAEYRKQAGLTNHLDDLIEYTPNIAPFGDRFCIDGVEYHHGYSYMIRRALYDVLREMEARGWDAEDRAGNPNRKYYRRPEMTQNPMLHQRFHERGWAIARETTFSAQGGPVINAPQNNAIRGGLAASI